MIKRLEISICGIALSFASLHNLLYKENNTLKSLFGIIAILLVFLYLLKIIFYRHCFFDEMKEKNNLAVLPTLSMSLLVLITYIRQDGILRWPYFIFFLIHISISIVFFFKYIKKFNLENFLPNYYIVFVAYSVFCINAYKYFLLDASKIVFIIASVLYFILTFVLLYRLIHLKLTNKKEMSTIWIFNSPINILINAYINTFTVNKYILVVMFTVSLISLILSLLYILHKKLITKSFNNYYATFTFPTVILLIAYKNVFKIFSFNMFIINIFGAFVIGIVLLIFVLYMKNLLFLKKC